MQEQFYRLEIRLLDLIGEGIYWGTGSIILIPQEKVAEGYISNDYVLLEANEETSTFCLINWNDNDILSFECNYDLFKQLPGFIVTNVEDFDDIGGIEISIARKIDDPMEMCEIRDTLEQVKYMCNL